MSAEQFGLTVFAVFSGCWCWDIFDVMVLKPFATWYVRRKR